MPPAVTVDVAGGTMGGAARLRAEFYNYLARSNREDIKVIGDHQRVCPSWLLRREVTGPSRAKRIALNNVGFVSPGGERSTLLRNALHFLTEEEAARLEPSLLKLVGKQTTIVRLAARRSDQLVVPCASMAERVALVLPQLRERIAVRPHPVSANSIPLKPRDRAILCPVLFESYKPMTARLKELLNAMNKHNDESIRLRVTAGKAELPAELADHPAVDCLGKLNYHDLHDIWARSAAIYFPTSLESFGYPLAEARVSGHPVIALNTAQNKEIAGPALCGFTTDDPTSLQDAIDQALTMGLMPDPQPFEPNSYFDWLLGPPR